MIVMKRKKGFTLIELLVVIAVIAVLISMLLPALQNARKQAQAVFCLSGLGQLTMAWFIYADDNAGLMVGALAQPAPPDYDPLDFTNYFHPKWYHWVTEPADPLSLESRKQSCRDGLLFEYVNDIDAYHCPTDKAKWRTYCITGGLNGEGIWVSTTEVKPPVTKISHVRRPSDKVVFVEEQRSYSSNSWIMPLTQPFWNDRVAIWHGNAGNLGFADGHAEKKQWVDESTVLSCTEFAEVTLYKALYSDDLKYMQQRLNSNDTKLEYKYGPY